MSVYFSGIQQVDEFSHSIKSENERIDVRVYERWVDTDISSVARCGDTGFCEVEVSEGFAKKSIENIKGVIETTLGVDGFASLKSRLETQLGQELQWSQSKRVTQRFDHSSPKCGRKVITIFNLVREFEVTYLRRRRFTLKSDVWDEKWTRILPYQTNKHDALPDISPYDELCECPDATYAEYDGRVCFDFGNVSFRVPYRLRGDGLDVQIFDHVVSLDFEDSAAQIRALEEGMEMQVPSELLPDVVRFLGKIEGSEATARVFRFVDTGRVSRSSETTATAYAGLEATLRTTGVQFLEE